MKKIGLLVTCAALAWSMQACNNSNRNNTDTDSLYQDTMDMAPMDTTGMGMDTMDTSGMTTMPMDTTSM